jgi:formylglycine-generating enzyme required for sulfatase activity
MPIQAGDLGALLLLLSSQIEDLQDLLRSPAFHKAYPAAGPALLVRLDWRGGLQPVSERLAAALVAQGLNTDGLYDAILDWRPHQRDAIDAAFGRGLAPIRAAPALTAAAFAPPARPWPGLDRCAHPMQLGGRSEDLGKLLDAVADPTGGVLLLYATSGAGKSSLLKVGLAPALRARGVPVVLNDQPATPGLAGRLLRALGAGGTGAEPSPAALVEALAAAGRQQGGARPVIVLDQAEDLLLHATQRRALETWLVRFVAANAAAGPALSIVLSYRSELHDRFCSLLLHPDALLPEAEALGAALAYGTHELPVLGLRSAAAPGRAQRCFEDAVTRPLREGSYPVRFADPGTPAAIAAALVDLRDADDPRAPLTPELQVLLAELHEAAEPGPDGLLWIAAPADLGACLRDALLRHVHAAIEVALEGEGLGKAEARSELIALLHTFVDDEGRRRPVPVDDPSLAAPAVQARLRRLQGARCRLLRQEEQNDRLFYTLAHDQVAARVRDLYTSAARSEADPGLLELLRLAEARAALWARGDRGAADLSPEVAARLAESLPRVPATTALRAWWAEAQARARAARAQALRHEVRREAPRLGAPLRALRLLQVEHGLDGAALVGVLALSTDFDEERRDAIFGEGASTLSDEEQAAVLPPLLAALAPAVPGQQSEDNLWGALLAAADAMRPGPVQDAAIAVVVQALVARKGPPPPFREDDWSPVIAGDFQVGRFPEDEGGQDNEQLHTVVLSPYRIAKVAVTFTEWWAFHVGGQGGDPAWYGPCPADTVSWYEARAYAAWRGCRLPTERQWEAACRGGKAEAYARGPHWAGGADALQKWAVHAESRPKLGIGSRPMDAATPIDGSPAHPLGLVHIQGNMFTWTMDWYTDDYAAASLKDAVQHAVPNPTTPPGRVLRGGSWYDSSSSARAARRGRDRPGGRDASVGLRLVLPQPAGAGS